MSQRPDEAPQASFPALAIGVPTTIDVVLGESCVRDGTAVATVVRAPNNVAAVEWTAALTVWPRH